MNFTWNVTYFEKREMDLQIKFSNPEEVSYGQTDTLVIKFINPSIFNSTDGVMLREGTILSRELPRQIDS